MPIDVEQFMCRSDNFGILVRDRETGLTALVDAPEESTILAAVERTGWKPSLILTTHHHIDHVEANLALKQRFGLEIIAPAAEASKIPGVDRRVAEGNAIAFGEENIQVIETPGHTAGHVSYYFPRSGVVFTADTLFALGCGRLFECPPPVMHRADIFGQKRAMVLGEFGGLGLPLEGHTWQAKANWGYQSFENADALLAEYARFVGLIEGFIPRGLSGAIYTQVSDVEIEVNGLMTYDRKVVKMPAEKLKALNERLWRR